MTQFSSICNKSQWINLKPHLIIPKREDSICYQEKTKLLKILLLIISAEGVAEIRNQRSLNNLSYSQRLIINSLTCLLLNLHTSQMIHSMNQTTLLRNLSRLYPSTMSQWRQIPLEVKEDSFRKSHRWQGRTSWTAQILVTFNNLWIHWSILNLNLPEV